MHSLLAYIVTQTVLHELHEIHARVKITIMKVTKSIFRGQRECKGN